MSDFTMTIGGDAESIVGVFEVVDPSTGESFAEAPDCEQYQLDAAFFAAAEATTSWAADERGRRDALEDVARVLRDSVEDLAHTLTVEQGKPISASRSEVNGAAQWVEHFAAVEVPREIAQDDDVGFAEIVRPPLGVVAAITPWNYPILLAWWKLAPALRAGNTVVLKPSPFTPLSSLRFGELLRGVLPDGVLNVVSGGDDLGAAMTAHPVPRKISFTGSVDTGKKVAISAAGDLKRLTLELGGNDAAIVLDDANVSEVAQSLFDGAFANNGQVCSAIKRIYAPANLYEDLVSGLASIADSTKVGSGLDPDVQLGPINNRPQHTLVSALVDEAIASGAHAAAGGSAMDRPGFFFEPTILARASGGMRIVEEEQFGPALPVIVYDDVEEAIFQANATHFGLSGSVWSSDDERAARLANRLECGTVWINDHMTFAPYLPFGGRKWSGMGVESGIHGLHGFCDLQLQYIRRS